MEQEDKKFAEWNGIPREEISWNPTIDFDKCIGCGACLRKCTRGVYELDNKTGKLAVKNPLHCFVGCTGCKPVCPTGAISFPDKRYVDGLLKKRSLVDKEGSCCSAPPSKKGVAKSEKC
jgi:NAD-dependent dihydropyrimidine dehydrogenase PreA subunit